MAICEGSDPIEASDLPATVSPEECDLEGGVIRDAGVGVTVPRPGEGAGVFATGADGSEEFLVETLADGTVVLSYVGSEAEDGSGESTTSEAQSALAATPACEDDAGRTVWHESDLHEWRIKTSSIPSSLDQAKAIDRIRNGIRNITQAYNDCGLADTVGATSNYLGSTTLSANYNGTDCTTNDGTNVVDFGTDNAGRAALTCTWKNGSELTNADVRMNSAKGWTVNAGAGWQ